MNYTAQKRIDLLNGNCWSKNEVRLLIRDLEEQDKQIKALDKVIQSQQATIVELQKQVKDLYNEKLSK